MKKIIEIVGKTFIAAILIVLVLFEVQIGMSDRYEESVTFSNWDISLVTKSAFAFGGGNLSCADLSNCGSSASCGEAGTVDGCYLNCESGSSVRCTSGSDPGEN